MRKQRNAVGALATVLCGVLPGCASQSAAPASQPSEPSPEPPSNLQPPTFAKTRALGPIVPRDDPRSSRSELRREIFTAAWTLVRDKHYDKTLGGLDWNASRAKYERLAVAAPDEPTFYRVMNDMLGDLGQSHLEISGPGAQPNPILTEAALDTARPVAAATSPGGDPAIVMSTDTGDPGFVVRSIDGKPTVTSVRARSSAARAGLRAGYIVTHIGGQPLQALPPSSRPLRPVEERFYLRLAAARRLSGPVGTRISVRFIDANDQTGEALLTRDPPQGKAVQIGLLPPLYPEVRVTQVGNIGIIAFNFFLLDPVLSEVQRAIDGFRARGAKGLIIDLRGNPGGIGAMAIPVAARLVTKKVVLGTIQYREFSNTLTATPPMGIKPFTGRVVIVTDEGTASTSEIFAAGLQEAGRAIVVGDSTLGAVLPSTIESLPGGAVMQLVVADFKTPKGILLEGRGVQPDKRVLETRAALKTGRDPVLDAALTAARTPMVP